MTGVTWNGPVLLKFYELEEEAITEFEKLGGSVIQAGLMIQHELNYKSMQGDI